jgi:4-hydroxybenzoate polyprenyltransferase
MMVGLFAAAGNSAHTVLIGASAVLSGQLSIGWSNDALDASRDQISGRSDKPVALGALTSSFVMRAAVVAAGTCVVLSLLLGWRPAAVHLVGVGCGWLYNAVAKSTPWSPLPFAIAFGGLPAVATLALPDHPWPPLWSMAAGALIGIAAHFANVLPDLDDDRRTGVRGLPHRAGRLGSALVATLSALTACIIVTFASGSPSTEDLIALAAAVAIAIGGLVLLRRRGGGEAVFGATIAVAAIGVIELATSPGFPTAH